MGRALVTAALAGVLALPVGAANEPAEQAVTPLGGGAVQRVEPLHVQGEQRVEALDQQGVQAIGGGTKSRSRRAVETGGKVVLGVLAAAIAIGATVASLLLL